ncbi:hypothetical protein L6452_01327 [Arctium lappa]|uniref:Uncharacterized protein n=1 Tax=Arctium lappa TaxID=4217 RepID=A0ACB9FHU8_ARCLA|nr:hypothetical protein L6452_01327 [Arctium lappa]
MIRIFFFFVNVDTAFLSSHRLSFSASHSSGDHNHGHHLLNTSGFGSKLLYLICEIHHHLEMSGDGNTHWCYQCLQPVRLQRQNPVCSCCSGGFVRELNVVVVDGQQDFDPFHGHGGNSSEDGGQNQGRRNPLSFLWPFGS